jgi:putative membrane protein
MPDGAGRPATLNSESSMNPNLAAILLATGVLAPCVLPVTVHGQSTGGQSGPGNPMANPATPMQQQPSGTNPGTAATQMSPQQFALTVGSANKFEVIEGELALAQASDPKLKEFARMMVKDHTVALQELQAVAKAANIVLPPDIALDATHQAKFNAIRNRKGAEFDQAYRTDQVQAHQQMLAILDTYATAGGNPALKAWAVTAVAMVRKHLEHLQALGMGGGSR